MPLDASGQRVIARPRVKRWLDELWQRLTKINTVPALAFAAFLAGAAVVLMYSPLRQMEVGDEAGYDYMAQCILRGQIPYRDVVDSKGPLSMYLSALVMAIGKTVGLQDVIAVRLFYVLLGGILCAVTFLVAEAYFSSRIAGAIAFAVPLMSAQFVEMMVGGTRPKIPMIIFGLITLLLIARDRPFWAGFCSMLSCLCWQPGLAFTGVAVLMFSRYLTSWRDLRAIRVLLGAAIPLAVVISYFSAVGALRDLWNWTVHYNYSVYMPEGNEPAGTALALTWRLINEAMGANAFWVKLSIVGALIYGITCVRVRFKERKLVELPNMWKDAVLMPPLVHLGFCIVNWPGRDNLIPFFPFIGIFAGYFVVTVARTIIAIPFIKRNAFAARVIEWAPVIPLVLVLLSVINHAKAYQIEPGRTLQDQQAAFKAVADMLGPDDKIYVHGTVQLLVLLNRRNLNPYIFLPYGKDDYIASTLPGGFKTLVNEMEAQAPKVIALSRLRTVWHREELVDWAEEHYDKLPIEFGHNGVYVRKER
jgi:DolP-mannose mannosyltransferase